MKQAQVLKAVQDAWWALERAGGHTDLLGKCERESERVEREHRAMGRRFTHNANHYTLSVGWAARYFVCKHVGIAMPVPTTWRDFESFRADIPMCQALREQLASEGKLENFQVHYTRAFQEIDYAGDIALPC